MVGSGAVGSLALAGALALIFGAISIPFDYVATFQVEQKFGFNRSTRALFFTDLLKSILLTVAFMAPLMLAIDYAARQLGEAWWIAVWGILVAFNVLALLIVPTVVMPLFNKFEPLADEGLKARIEISRNAAASVRAACSRWTAASARATAMPSSPASDRPSGSCCSIRCWRRWRRARSRRCWRTRSGISGCATS